MAIQDSKRKAPREELRLPISILFFAAALFSIIYLYYSGLPVLISTALALLALAVSGIVISRINGFEGFYGIYMLKSSRGLDLIDRVSRHNVLFWRTLAEWGAVMGFGALSLILFRKGISRMAMAIGVASIAALVLLIVPNLGLISAFLSMPGISQQGAGIAFLQLPVFSYVIVALLAISLLGGISLFFISLIALVSISTVYSILSTLSTVVAGNPNYSLLSSQLPGVSPVIPGLTIPLFSGILALAVVLTVHEFSHGILSRVAKVRLKSIGLLPFGIIPVGAFVEPDEKQVSRLDKNRQNDIFIAGIASNLLLTFVFFALTALLIIYVMPIFFTTGVVVSATVPGAPANNVLVPGSVVYKWNGYKIINISSLATAEHNFTSFATITVNTSKGNYTLRSNSTGKIGVLLSEAKIPRSQGPQNGIVNFIYSFLVLSFVLNFFVGAMNLLPLPMLDGWRIYKNRISSKKTLHAIGWLVFAALIILALPWLWVGSLH